VKKGKPRNSNTRKFRTRKIASTLNTTIPTKSIQNKIADTKRERKFVPRSIKGEAVSEEDLGVAIMNLIAIEEHLYFTYGKTKKEKYLELLNEVREMRKKYLAKIVKNPEGEIWCISKHLLSSSMRLMEVGTKLLHGGRKGEAEELFDNAQSLWNMFWGLNFNLIDVADVKKEETDNNEIALDNGEKVSVFHKLGKIVGKILDCCRE